MAHAVSRRGAGSGEDEKSGGRAAKSGRYAREQPSGRAQSRKVRLAD